MVRPYAKVTLTFLADELCLTVPQIESLLIDLIVTEQLQATIDAVHGHVLLHSHNNSNSSNSHSHDSKVYQELVWLHTFDSFVQQFPDY